jgi:hypothetical protein
MDSKVVCRLKWMKVQLPDCEEEMTTFKTHRSVSVPQGVIFGRFILGSLHSAITKVFYHPQIERTLKK